MNAPATQISDKSTEPLSDLTDVRSSDPTFVVVEKARRVEAVQERSTTVLGPYHLETMLGQGAMGCVYVATHTKLKRKVALKTLPPSLSDDETRVARFMHEMEAVGRLDHENIIRATDAGEVDGVHYLAMELIEGIDLQTLIKQRSRLDFGAACEIIRQAAMGLHHVQQNNLVHRDIKPSNLMLTKDGVVKILDLGIARLRADDRVGTLTADGGLMGTPDFIAPEQIHETGCVDIRADIYSLGCTLYRFVSGCAPFDGPEYGTQVAKILGHAQDTPTDVRELVEDLPEALASLISQTMEKQPEDRPQTPLELAAAMERFADRAALNELAGHHSREIDASGSVRLQIRARRELSAQGKSLPGPVWPIAALALLAMGAIVWAVIGGRGQGPSQPAPALGVLPAGDTETAVRSLQAVAENTAEIRDATRQFVTSNQQIRQDTSRIATSLDELRAEFRNLQTSGVVPNPQSVGEFYHNARVYVSQGKNQLARQSFVDLLRSGSNFADVHRRFQEFLTLQEGRVGAREFYESFYSRDAEDPMAQWVLARLGEGEQQLQDLQAIVDGSPDFAPAVYDLSRAFAIGGQTLAQRQSERQLLEQYLRLHEQGKVLPYYLDQADAALAIEDATHRSLAGATPATTLDEPVQLVFSQHNRGWDVHVQIAEAARDVFYRTDSNGEFRSLGHRRQLDSRTGTNRPRSSFSLPAINPPQQIEVRYVDRAGLERGPYAFDFDADLESKRLAKEILQRTQNSWVSFRGNKLYLTHLTAYQRGIKEVRYAIDQALPTQVHPLPPVSGKRGDRSFFVEVPKLAKSAVVELTYFDGELSEAIRFERP